MTLFALIGLLITIFCIILALLILKYAQNSIQRLWGAFNIIVSFWAYGTYLAGISATSKEAIFAWRLAYLGATFIAIIFYHLVCLFCQLKKRKWLVFAYVQGLFFTPIILFSEAFISDTVYIFNSIYYHKATYLLSIWLTLWSTIAYLAFRNLHKFKKTLDGINRIQASYLFWGMLIGFTGGVTSALPAYGSPLYPGYHLSVAIYALIMPFAIFKYRLLELTIIIKRSIIYSVLIAVVSLFYILIVFILEKFTQGVLGYSSFIISISIAFGFGLIFFPLRNHIQYFLDRLFFRGTHEEIVIQNQQLRREIAQSEKYKTLSTLSSGIAHEIKNPLTAIKTFSEYLPKKLEDKEFLTKFSEIVGHEVDRIDGMVHQLLDYGKPAPLSIKETDIQKLIHETLDILNSKFITQKVTVRKSLSPDACVFLIDPNRIKQALLNILLNAVDAMPDGGQLTVTTAVSRSLFTIRVKDTGGGIAPEDLKQIFDPFFSKKDHGTGLGLSITQGIIEEHRGKIKVNSTVGAGTEFVIELPIKEVTES